MQKTHHQAGLKKLKAGKSLYCIEPCRDANSGPCSAAPVHRRSKSLAPKCEKVKSASVEEGKVLNLHAGSTWALQVVCPPARVGESCLKGTCWWQLLNSEGQTWLHKVFLVGGPLLVCADVLLRFCLLCWAPQGHFWLRTWEQGQNCRVEGDQDG